MSVDRIKVKAGELSMYIVSAGMGQNRERKKVHEDDKREHIRSVMGSVVQTPMLL
jgi:hypothetical protein